MTTNHHTAIANGAAANSSVVNAPLGELDAAIGPMAARYSTATGSIPNTTITIIDYGTEVFDTHSAVTTGASWQFEAPSDGTYWVYACAALGATTTWASAERVYLAIYKNGSIDSQVERKDNFDSSSHTAQVSGGALIELSAEDTIDIRISQNSGGSLSLSAAASQNYVCIFRV